MGYAEKSPVLIIQQHCGNVKGGHLRLHEQLGNVTHAEAIQPLSFPG
jgi:hypothetical protein